MPALRRRRGVGEDHDARFEPLAPCTVITRTSSRAISMSRLMLARAARSQRDEALQRRRLVTLVVEREIEELVERVGGLIPEPC